MRASSMVASRAATIVSGIQPTTAVPHIGNYLGAFVNWKRMQDSAPVDQNVLFFLADLHAMTVAYDPMALRESCRSMAASFLACGIDPARSAVFRQSAVPEHSELCWILTCHTQMGWLQRMTQFKQKSAKGKAGAASLGLFSYPVLMAADVLLYKAVDIPVGDDQKQHLELAAQISTAFNHKAGTQVFPIPQPQFVPNSTRVMSLRDGTSKMSKSDASALSRIDMTDDADTIALKVRKAKTDSGGEWVFDREARPERSNLIALYADVAGWSVDDVVQEFEGQSTADFKAALTSVLVDTIVPIGDEIRRLNADPTHLDSVLAAGAATARSIAGDTMASVRESVGLSAVV